MFVVCRRSWAAEQACSLPTLNAKSDLISSRRHPLFSCFPFQTINNAQRIGGSAPLDLGLLSLLTDWLLWSSCPLISELLNHVHRLTTVSVLTVDKTVIQKRQRLQGRYRLPVFAHRNKNDEKDDNCGALEERIRDNAIDLKISNNNPLCRIRAQSTDSRTVRYRVISSHGSEIKPSFY